jgi:hypothetical protein
VQNNQLQSARQGAQRAKRETLYADFIAQVGRAIVDSYIAPNRSLKELRDAFMDNGRTSAARGEDKHLNPLCAAFLNKAIVCP